MIVWKEEGPGSRTELGQQICSVDSALGGRPVGFGCVIFWVALDPVQVGAVRGSPNRGEDRATWHVCDSR